VATMPTQAIERFNSSVKQVEALLFIARASELQEQACATLDAEIEELSREKRTAIQANDEDYANLLLGCECVNRFLFSELRMWLLLKASEPEAAWNELVSAQKAAEAAGRAHPGFSHLKQHVAKLEAIEQLVFPPQVFMSSGIVAKVQRCSICDAEYGECSHLAGLPYMGSFCQIRMEELILDHASIVENPSDKRCRVTTFNVESGIRNRMTWAVEPHRDK
jgi:hypothetical protein